MYKFSCSQLSTSHSLIFLLEICYSRAGRRDETRDGWKLKSSWLEVPQIHLRIEVWQHDSDRSVELRRARTPVASLKVIRFYESPPPLSSLTIRPRRSFKLLYCVIKKKSGKRYASEKNEKWFPAGSLQRWVAKFSCRKSKCIIYVLFNYLFLNFYLLFFRIKSTIWMLLYIIVQNDKAAIDGGSKLLQILVIYLNIICSAVLIFNG